MSIPQRPFFERWFAPGVLPTEPRALALEVQRTFAVLELTLDRMIQALEFGPIPGQYFPIQFCATDTAGLGAVDPADRAITNFDFFPIFLGAWIDTGSLTIDVKDSVGSILASTQSVATELTLEDRADFDDDRSPSRSPVLSGTVSLQIVSIDSGTPTELRVLLVGKRVEKIEPPLKKP